MVTLSASAAPMVTENVPLAEAPAASVTVAVKLNVPFALGVPSNTPGLPGLAEVSRVRPGGRPALAFQVKAPVPPVASMNVE